MAQSGDHEAVIKKKAYQLQPVYTRILLDKAVDIPICHPVRYHCEAGLRHCYPDQRKDIRMPEGFPPNSLLTEPLHRALSAHGHVGTKHNHRLTPITLCKSLFECTLMTFSATSRPQCSPFHTSANPPLNTGLPVRSGGIEVFKVVGRSAWRPHILHNDLRQFSRVRGEISGLSSAW